MSNQIKKLLAKKYKKHQNGTHYTLRRARVQKVLKTIYDSGLLNFISWGSVLLKPK